MTGRPFHTLKIKFDSASGNLTSLSLTNALGQLDAPGDMPAVVSLTPEGRLARASWERNGRTHRDNDLPAIIDYDDNGLPHGWAWYQFGDQHREGDKPALISFFDGTLKELQCVFFYRRGVPYREAGKIETFNFDPDGTAYDYGENVVQFEGLDPSWLLTPVPTVVVPEPLLSLLKLPVFKP